MTMVFLVFVHERGILALAGLKSGGNRENVGKLGKQLKQYLCDRSAYFFFVIIWQNSETSNHN